MKDTERVLIVLSVLLLVVKMLFGGVDIFIFIILSVLTLYYYCLGFFLLNNIHFEEILKRSAYRHISPVRIIGSIAASMFLSSLIVGILFKLMEYEGNLHLLAIGLMAVATVLLISLVKYLLTKDRFYLNVIFRFAHWEVLGLIIQAINF